MNKPFFFQMLVKEVNTDQSGAVIIEGLASTPDIDRYRDIVEPAAFQKGLEMFMKNPSLLRSHDPDRPAGTVLAATVTDKGLRIRGSVTEAETKEDVLQGRMRALSIGYIPLETELQHEDGTPFNFETDSAWDPDMVRVIKTLDLVEISIVTTPANGNALFTVAKSVKQFFHEVAMKSLKITKKDGGVEAPPETAPVETTEEKVEETKEEVKPEAPVTQQNDNQEDEDEGLETTEDVEKAGEKPAADGGEGGVELTEEPKAEAKPESESVASDPKDIEVPKVDEETAKSFPELVEAGLVMVDAKAAQVVAPSVKSLLRKLCDAYVVEAKRANDLQARLDKTPEKSALVVHSQFTAPESEGAAKQKENSPYFKQLFGIK